jgi:hypothetical protein
MQILRTYTTNIYHFGFLKQLHSAYTKIIRIIFFCICIYFVLLSFSIIISLIISLLLLFLSHWHIALLIYMCFSELREVQLNLHTDIEPYDTTIEDSSDKDTTLESESGTEFYRNIHETVLESVIYKDYVRDMGLITFLHEYYLKWDIELEEYEKDVVGTINWDGLLWWEEAYMYRDDDYFFRNDMFAFVDRRLARHFFAFMQRAHGHYFTLRRYGLILYFRLNIDMRLFMFKFRHVENIGLFDTLEVQEDEIFDQVKQAAAFTRQQLGDTVEEEEMFYLDAESTLDSDRLFLINFFFFPLTGIKNESFFAYNHHLDARNW